MTTKRNKNIECLWCESRKVVVTKETPTRIDYYCKSKDCGFADKKWEQTIYKEGGDTYE